MYVYVIGPENGPYKIGFTSNLKKRLGALQNASPLDLRIHHSVATCDENTAREVEMAAHERLASHRMRGEWFSCALHAAVNAVVYDGTPPRSSDENRKDREDELRHITSGLSHAKVIELAAAIGSPSSDLEELIQWRLDRQEEEMAARRRSRSAARSSMSY